MPTGIFFFNAYRCRLVIKFITSLQAYRLTSWKLQIPEGSTNSAIPEWLSPHCFPFRQRLTDSRPDSTH